jgi:hypothetical protein
MEAQIRAAGREPRMRTTLYGDVPQERRNAAFNAAPMAEVRGASAAKQQRSKRLLAVDKRQGAPDSLEVKWIDKSQDRTLYESVVLMAACN